MNNVFSDELSGFVVIFQSLSLFPYSSNPIGNLLLKFYSLLNVSLIVYIFVSAIYIYDVTKSKASIGVLVTELVLVGLIGAHFLSLFQSLLSHKQQLRIYQIFDEIDYIFHHQLLVNIRYRNIRRYLWQKFIIIVIILSSIKIVSIYYSGVYFQYSMHILLSIAILQIRCLQTVFYVDLINYKLTQLNKHISNLPERSAAEASAISCILMVPQQPHKSSVEEAQNQFIYDQILGLKQIYGKNISFMHNANAII